MLNITDHSLIEKIQQGNKTAFDHLFFKYYKPLYRFALHYCNNTLIAEESVQKTFIKIWQNNSHTKYADDIGKLLFTYTKNEVIDELRKVYTRKKYEGTTSYELIFEDTNNHDNKQRIKAIIESAIEQLPKKSKEIFRLAKQEGLSINEIANYLNISVKTVENQLRIAYKKMRLYLEPFKKQLNF
jgi:RNA polymerase sigma-70 factor (ECF subfamily)